MIRSLRKKLCKWFSMHVMDFEMNTKNFEVSRCRHCGRRAAVAHWTREVKLLGAKQ